MSINMEKSGGAGEAAVQLGVAYTIPRVNLLPPEITAARTFRRVQVGLGACVLLVAAAAAGTYVWSQGQVDDAQAALDVETARTATLQADAAQYAEVPTVLAQVDAAEAARATAMGTDVLWYQYLNDLSLAYPTGVWLTSVTASVTPPAADGSTATTVSADPLATPGIGTIQFAGAGLDNPDVANWLDVLAQTPGFADATLGGATRSESDGTPVVDFTTSVVLTDEALSHRYDQKAS